jgi:hypothetical protein
VESGASSVSASGDSPPDRAAASLGFASRFDRKPRVIRKARSRAVSY